MIRKDELTYHLLLSVISLLKPYYKYKLNSLLRHDSNKWKCDHGNFETGMKEYYAVSLVSRLFIQLMMISSKVRFSRTTGVISCGKMYILDFSYGKCHTIHHKMNPRFFILQMSHHAAQNKSWSWHQNIVTLPVSYLNKCTYYLPIFQIKCI